MAALPDIRARALAALVPPPRRALSQWIETSIRLPEGVSALSGAVRLWPWQREIADAIGDPKSAQSWSNRARRLQRAL